VAEVACQPFGLAAGGYNGEERSAAAASGHCG